MTSTYLVPPATNTSNNVDITIDIDSDSSDAWNFFSGLNLPLYFRAVSSYSGEEHSVLIYAVSSSTISICEANTSRGMATGGNAWCRVVNNQVLSYSDFLGRFTSIVRIVEPPTQHVHTQTAAFSGTNHRVECSGCGTALGAYHGSDAYYYDVPGDDIHILLCGTCNMVISPAESHYFDEDGYCICGYTKYWRRINSQTLELQ